MTNGATLTRREFQQIAHHTRLRRRSLKPPPFRVPALATLVESNAYEFVNPFGDVAHAARKVDQSAAQKVSHLEGGSFYADLRRRQYN